MRCRSVAGAVAIVGVLAANGWGQSNQNDVDELRKQIEALQEKLNSLEDAKPASRVTQIGERGTRLRGRVAGTVIRIYDLSDLFTVAPTYEAQRTTNLGGEASKLFPRPQSSYTGGGAGGGGFGGGGGGFGGGFNVKPDSARDVLRQDGSEARAGASLDNLIQAITTTISPDSWEEVGGPGSIATLGNSLVISNDEQAHEQISALLDLFRKRWGTLRTISVRAYWLWLDDSRLASLVSEKGAAADGAVAYGVVDAKAWQQLIDELGQPDNQLRAGYRAAVTCYNGQTVHSVSGSESLVVTGIEPVVLKGDTAAPAGRVAYKPVISILQEGAALQVTPIANQSGKIVLLDIHSRVSTRAEEEAQRKAKRGGGLEVLRADASDGPSPQQVVAALDRTKLTTHRLSTTLRVPVERPMLVGGMTFGSKPAPGAENLYLFVKLSVQELRDDLKRKPTKQPQPKQVTDTKKKRGF